MLLVDDDQPEPPKRGAVLQQGVGTDSEPRLARGEPLSHGGLLHRREPAQQQLGADAQRLHQLRQCDGVLLGQQLGRRHERRLVVVLDRQQHGEQRHHRLAGSHVAHEQSVHPLRSGHVGRDLAERLLLVLRERPREAFPEASGELALDLEGHAGAGPLGDRPRSNQHQLKVQQLVEREAPPSLLRLGDGPGAVHHAQCVGQRRQTGRAADALGHDVGRGADERVEVPVHQPADHLVAQALGRRVDR